MDIIDDPNITIFSFDGICQDYDQKKILCYGGFFNKEEIMIILDSIKEVKKKLGIDEWFPVKWNFLDEVKTFCFKNWKLPKEFAEKKFKKIKERSNEIRKEIISSIIEYIQVLVSVRTEELRSFNKETLKWVFENLFQRVGLIVKPSLFKITSLMCDYEDHKSIMYSKLLESYFEGYYVGKSYFSGPLKKKNLLPFLTFSRTIYNPFLQIADIIVGCFGDLLRSFVRKEKPRQFTLEIYNIIKSKFRSHRDKILGYGIIMKKDDEFKNYLKQYSLL